MLFSSTDRHGTLRPRRYTTGAVLVRHTHSERRTDDQAATNLRAEALSCGIALIAAITIPLAAAGADVFTWTDEKGTIHFSDSASDVPARHRNSIKTKKFGPDEELTPATPPATRDPDDDETAPPPEPAPTVAETIKRFEVPYQVYEGTARRVIVSVRFNNRVTAPMILDTGAPGSLISNELAERLDLFDKEHGRLFVSVGGSGGSAVGIRTVINRMEIGGAAIDFVPAEITDSISDKFEGLIGMDFMADYSMQVDPKKHVVVFEQLDAEGDRPGGHDKEWWRNTFRSFAASYNDWKQRLAAVEKEIERSSFPSSGLPAALERRRALARWQTQEAEKLMDRLGLALHCPHFMCPRKEG